MQGPGSLVMGASVAEAQFLKSLLEYGNFHALHVFTRESANTVCALQNTFGVVKSDSRAQYHDARYLPEFVASVSCDAFHAAFPSISQLAYLRERFSRKLFPITGIVHSLASLDVKSQIVRHLVFDSSVLDVVVNTSRAAETAFLKIMDEVQSDYWGRTYRAGRTCRIPLGVDFERFQPGKRPELRRANGLDPEAVVILYTGRISPWYKMELLPLLISFQRVNRAIGKLVDLQLLIVGQEQFPGYCNVLLAVANELGLKDRMQIWTEVPHDQLSGIYLMADIFVSPSDNVQETFGLAPLEAMAAGLPVVLSDWNGYKELIEDEKHGYLVPVYWCGGDPDIVDTASFRGMASIYFHLSHVAAVDVNILSDRLVKLASNPSLRQSMGSEARRHVIANFDWKAIVEQYENVWSEAAARASHFELPRRVSLYQPCYHNAFDHYPSSHLDDQDLVRLTKFGAELFDKYRPVAAVVQSLANLSSIRRETIQSIIEALRINESGYCVNELFHSSTSQHSVRCAVLFLLKNGIAELLNE